MSKSNEREGSNFRRLEAVVVEKSEADCFGTARYEWDVVDR